MRSENYPLSNKQQVSKTTKCSQVCRKKVRLRKVSLLLVATSFITVLTPLHRNHEIFVEDTIPLNTGSAFIGFAIVRKRCARETK